MNPAKPDEIVKELFNPNTEVADQFSKAFPVKILEFAGYVSEAYKIYMTLDRLISKKEEDIRLAYILTYTYMILENLFTSTKLFFMGYTAPSGNLMRQSLEAVAVSALISFNGKVKIKIKGKDKQVNYFELFEQNDKNIKIHRAVFDLERNHKELQMNKSAIEDLKKSRKFYHHFSHPGKMGLATLVTEDRTFFGGGFDVNKMEQYEKEMDFRINYCKLIPNIIEGIKQQVEQ